MATGTKQQWRKLSQQMREHTTPHELGEAVLALSQGKRAASSKTDYRIWVAVIIGAVFMLSIGVSREVTNSRALAAQVEEADRQSELAIEAQAEAERLAAEKSRLIENVRSLTMRYVQRGRDELLKLSDEDADQLPGEPFIAIRMAGEIIRQSGIDDTEFERFYSESRSVVLVELAKYLYPDAEVQDIEIITATEAIDDGNR